MIQTKPLFGDLDQTSKWAYFIENHIRTTTRRSTSYSGWSSVFLLTVSKWTYLDPHSRYIPRKQKGSVASISTMLLLISIAKNCLLENRIVLVFKVVFYVLVYCIQMNQRTLSRSLCTLIEDTFPESKEVLLFRLQLLSA